MDHNGALCPAGLPLNGAVSSWNGGTTGASSGTKQAMLLQSLLRCNSTVKRDGRREMPPNGKQSAAAAAAAERVLTLALTLVLLLALPPPLHVLQAQLLLLFEPGLASSCMRSKSQRRNSRASC